MADKQVRKKIKITRAFIQNNPGSLKQIATFLEDVRHTAVYFMSDSST